MLNESIFNLYLKFLYLIVGVVFLFSINNLTYAKNDIQQGDILAFDSSRACDVLVVKLEKMEEDIDNKQRIIKELHKILISAAKRPLNYGNIRSEYIKTFKKLEDTQKKYDKLVLVQEKNCLPKQDEKVKIREE